jgi:hypothetical protein
MVLSVLGGKIRKTGVVPNQIQVITGGCLVSRVDERAQARFGAVKSWVAGLTEIEPIVLIVADGEVAIVGTARRRRVDRAVAGLEDIRHARFDGRVAGFEILEHDGSGRVFGAHNDGQRADHQRERGAESISIRHPHQPAALSKMAGKS